MLDNVDWQYLNTFDKIALAVSGGKDSMALLDLFVKNFDKSKFFVVTVHHNLRGAEGQRDRDFVIDYCRQNFVECIVYEEDIPAFCKENGYGIEQGARLRRRSIFKQLVDSKKADRVATAHHLDDQAESILMHIFRGSGIKGLCGMSLDDGILIRPLLDISRKEIDKYISLNKIPFVEDSTNQCVDYTRNKLRKEILPLIESAYDGAKNNIIRLSKRARETYNFIDASCHNYKAVDNEIYIPLENFEKPSIVIAQTLINAVDSITTRVDLTSAHINKIVELAKKQNGASIDLPFGLKAHKQQNNIVLALTKEEVFSGEINGYGEYVVGDKVLVLSSQQTPDSALRCDLDKLRGGVIRNRKTGDTFRRFKGGTKSLGDYLTDKKVPKRLRDNIIVVAKENIVYLLPEYEISDNIKIDENTKNIAYISLKSNASKNKIVN